MAARRETGRGPRPRSWPGRARLWAVAALAVTACNNPSVQGGGDGGPRFQVGALDFRPVSGAAVTTDSGFALYLSDHPDTCAAISFVPAGVVTVLELKVAPQAGGTAQATVVARKVQPAAGEAVGGLLQSAGGTAGTGYDAGNGAVAWTANLDGSVELDALDVGFTGADGRVALSGVHLPACSP